MEQSYKILAAQRLSVDPALLLQVLEQGESVLVTTFDGKEHKFTRAELRKPPVKEVAEKREKTVKSAPGAAPTAAIPVAKPKAKK